MAGAQNAPPTASTGLHDLRLQSRSTQRTRGSDWPTIVRKCLAPYARKLTVWTKPTQKVAQRYGVSDVAIAKACTLLDIPKPTRGYWAKKAVGRTLTARPPLPKRNR